MTNPILTPLTDAQRDAVIHMDGPMLVLAGAGSGKTRVVTHRIAYLISKGVKPWEILGMTFTNKAAKEMKYRVGQLCKASPTWLGTFHSICARMLRADIEKLDAGWSSRFTIFDPSDQKDVVNLILKDLSLGSLFKPSEALDEILRNKRRFLTAAKLEQSNRRIPETVITLLREYENRMRAMNALDFDDLLIQVVNLLQSNEEVRTKYNQRFRYVLVDEYQDTNKVQSLLLELLAGANRNLHVTGDPDQSIYSWRGADYRNIMSFADQYPGAVVVNLNENFRSTRNILDAANTLIGHSEDRVKKDLFTRRGAGAKVHVHALQDGDAEARWVVRKIMKLNEQGTPLRDMAIFYRTNNQTRPFEEALIHKTIPYQIIGAIRFYERKEIKDLFAHLRLLLNPTDVLAFDRVVNTRPGIGPKTVEKMAGMASTHSQTAFEFLARDDFEQVHDGKASPRLKKLAAWCRQFAQIPRETLLDCVQQVLDLSELQAYYDAVDAKDPLKDGTRVGNLDSFLERVQIFHRDNPKGTLNGLLQDITLVADIDYHNEENDCLVLMTLHSAKGLEFPVVFIGGVEEEYLPHRNCFHTEQVDEERRLFFVGITRAQRELYITHAESRYQWNSDCYRTPSRFLMELECAAVEQDSWLGNDKYETLQRLDRLMKGDDDEDDDGLLG